MQVSYHYKNHPKKTYTVSWGRLPALVVALWNAFCVAGYLCLDIWLWQLFYSFEAQHKPTDRAYASKAFALFLISAAHYGYRFIESLFRWLSRDTEKRQEERQTKKQRKKQKKKQKQEWDGLVPLLPILSLGHFILLIINIKLLFYFCKWLLQFWSGGEIRDAAHCIASIVAVAIQILWDFHLFCTSLLIYFIQVFF
jgi:hypothetical protein